MKRFTPIVRSLITELYRKHTTIGQRNTLPSFMREVERVLVEHSVDTHGDVLTRAAEALGISKQTLWAKLQRLKTED